MTPCAGCGTKIGSDACRARFHELTARDFTDLLFFSVHRLMVDAYCLQHPDEYCVSSKSLAAHLMGVCWSLEFGGTRATPNESIRKWVEQHPSLEKPQVPTQRGALTIVAVASSGDVEAYALAVDAWARSVWDAYGSLHSAARGWVNAALNGTTLRR